VTSINLFYNQIGVEGAKALAEALETNKTVTSISLTHNQIGDEGAKALAEALKANETVTSINLFDNRIGDEGAKMIRKALMINVSVTMLDLDSDYIDTQIVRSIDNALQINEQLQWSRIHPYLLELCIVFAPLRLPPYVMLEIVDWLPTHVAIKDVDFNESCIHKVSHINKIRLFVRFQEVYNRLLFTRSERSLKRNC